MQDRCRLPAISTLALLGFVSLPSAACRDTPMAPDPPPTGNPTAVAADMVPTGVPFRGTLLTTQQIPDPNPPAGCDLFAHTAQTGTATHLGRFTGAGTTCSFNLQMGVLAPPINPGGGPPPYLVADFHVEQTQTSADGDVLETAGDGLFVQSLTDGSAGFVGSGTIEGGTGRFQGATGTFDIRGVAGEAATYDGWIVFDASMRSH